MKRVQTFSYRIKDATSGKHLREAAGCVNFVWNYINDTSHRAITERNQWMTEYDFHQYLSGASKELPQLHSQTIQSITKEYVKARKQFKKNKLRWRSAKGKTLGWIPFKASGVKLKGDTIKYRGKTYRFWLSRPLPEEAKLVTGSFNQDSRGRWYVNLQFRFEEDQPVPSTGKEVGIDLGLKTQLTCSDGIKLERPNLTKRYEEKLAKAQRANKKKLVRAIHAKVKNTRKDWDHKTSTWLVENYDLIRVGNVNSSGLMKTRMAKGVADAGWYQLKTMLEYKALMHGVDFAETNESYSTVTCSSCGERTGPTGLQGLSVREWVCKNCAESHDRDVNAAKNILLFSTVGRPDAGRFPTNGSNASSCGSKRGSAKTRPLGH